MHDTVNDPNLVINAIAIPITTTIQHRLADFHIPGIYICIKACKFIFHLDKLSQIMYKNLIIGKLKDKWFL